MDGMGTKKLSTLTALALVIFLVGCDGMSSKKSKSPAPANPSGNAGPGAGGGGSGQDIAASIAYYKGGFAAQPGEPNWSHDMLIDFNQVVQEGGYLVSAKHTDPLCFKTGALSSVKTHELFDLLAKLLVLPSTGPITPDDGLEYVEITLTTGEKRKYHLLNANVPAGELYATNPDDVRTFLQGVEGGLAVACQ